MVTSLVHMSRRGCYIYKMASPIVVVDIVVDCVVVLYTFYGVT